jgi:ABC-type glycerol-3-phosphate transport system substrate-binding protein
MEHTSRRRGGIRGALALTTAVAAIAAVTGCSSGGGGGNEPAEGAEEDKTITIWHYVGVDGAQVENMDAKEAAFLEDHEGVKFEQVNIPYGDLNNRLIAAAQTETGPDLIMADGANAKQLSEAGALAPMQECASSWESFDDILPAAMREVDGELYGVLPYLNLIALWYNADLLEESGVEVPTNLDELEQAMDEVVAAGHQGLVLDGTPDFPGAWTSRPLMTAQGVDFPDVEVEGVSAALARIGSWVENGWVPRDVVGYDQSAAFNEWMTGDFAFTLNGNWNITRAKEEKTFEYGVVPFPSGDSQAQVYVSGETAMLGAFGDSAQLACDYLGEQWFTPEGSLQSLEMIGSLPVLESLSSDPSIEEDPVLLAFAEAAKSGGSVPGGDQFIVLNTIWGPAYSEVLTGADPQAVGERLVAEVEAELAE